MTATDCLKRVEVERFRDLIARCLGLQFDEGKWDFLSEILRQRVEETGCGQAAAYLGRLSDPDEARRELRTLAARLTVAESYFFRNKGHFRVFTDVVLPAYSRLNSRHRQLRI